MGIDTPRCPPLFVALCNFPLSPLTKNQLCRLRCINCSKSQRSEARGGNYNLTRLPHPNLTRNLPVWVNIYGSTHLTCLLNASGTGMKLDPFSQLMTHLFEIYIHFKILTLSKLESKPLDIMILLNP